MCGISKIGRKYWIIYGDHQQISAQGYATFNETSDDWTNYTLVGPLSFLLAYSTAIIR